MRYSLVQLDNFSTKGNMKFMSDPTIQLWPADEANHKNNQFPPMVYKSHSQFMYCLNIIKYIYSRDFIVTRDASRFLVVFFGWLINYTDLPSSFNFSRLFLKKNLSSFHSKLIMWYALWSIFSNFGLTQ